MTTIREPFDMPAEGYQLRENASRIAQQFLQRPNHRSNRYYDNYERDESDGRWRLVRMPRR